MLDLGSLRSKFEAQLEVKVHPILIAEAEQTFNNIKICETLIN
jgi:hypothetical protein